LGVFSAMRFRIAEPAEQEPSEGVAALEARGAAVGVEHVCMHPAGQAMLCGVDSFDHVGSDVARRAGAALAAAVPCIEGRGAVPQRGEPFLGVDHLVGVRRSARVLERETKAGIASEFARTLAQVGWVAGFALVVRLVEDGA
jgi:hypothetical protein